MNKLSNQPPKGTSDWLPEEFSIRKYIFDTWQKVCLSFGYEQYLTPIIESAEVFKAKSGEDVGGKELMIMKDRAGRELAIRPEMTPSVTRMVTKIYDSSIKPIRLFSIANFLRNEKPQRGRNREFWQLNCDIFGTTDSSKINSEVEILQIAIEIMLSFNPPKNSFKVNINDRQLIQLVIVDIARIDFSKIPLVARILDKYEKLDQEVIKKMLLDLNISLESIEYLLRFMECKSLEELDKKIPEVKKLGEEILNHSFSILKKLNNLGYGEWINFNPSIIRGFDYYDGIVFEVFDNHKDNNRAMFGGGRYNGLSNIFGVKDMPAIGFAPGDETTRLFLESWGLLDSIKLKIKRDKYYLPLLSDNLSEKAYQVAKLLRREDKNIETGLTITSIGKALDYANKKEIDFVIIYGEVEDKFKIYTLKNMKTGEQINIDLKD